MLPVFEVFSLPSRISSVAFLTAGPQEMLIVGVIALLLFGKRLPEVARNLGKGFSEFKKGMSGFEDEVRNASSTTRRPGNYSSGSTSSSANRPAPQADSETEADDEFAAPKFNLDE